MSLSHDDAERLHDLIKSKLPDTLFVEYEQGGYDCPLLVSVSNVDGYGSDFKVDIRIGHDFEIDDPSKGHYYTSVLAYATEVEEDDKTFTGPEAIDEIAKYITERFGDVDQGS